VGKDIKAVDIDILTAKNLLFFWSGCRFALQNYDRWIGKPVEINASARMPMAGEVIDGDGD